MTRTTHRPRYDVIQKTKTQLIDRVGLATVLILAVTIAPLFDGVFFSAAASGQLSLVSGSGPWPAITFGAACFSGGGAIAGALTLTGSRRRRVLTIFGIYLTIGLGMLGELIVLAWTPWQLPAAVPVIGAFVLLALAAVMIGMHLSVQPLTMLGILFAFAMILANTGSAASPRPAFALGPALIAATLALSMGFLVTLTAALLPARLTRVLDPVWITRAGALSVATIAFMELGAPLPDRLSLLILLGGILLPPTLRRLSSWWTTGSPGPHQEVLS